MESGSDTPEGRPAGLTGGPARRRSGRAPSAYEIREEWLTCALDFPYWCNRWVQVYDAARASAGGAGGWLPFRLWPAQRSVANTLQQRRLVVMLKARQLGMSWLVTAYGLWLMLFHPAATVLLFSKRDTEAVHLLKFRLAGMHARLPKWMQAKELVVDNSHELRLSNGSAALAFPTTGGRSYTATLAVVDEADYVCGGGGDLEALLDAVKPTIDAGGRLVLVSTVDKSSPGSAFKRIYEAAKAGGANGVGGNAYAPVFLPWSARPGRTAEWYEQVKRDIWARSGSYDSLYAEYPATDVEALAALSSDARFAAAWCSAADDTLAAAIIYHKDTKAQRSAKEDDISFVSSFLCVEEEQHKETKAQRSAKENDSSFVPSCLGGGLRPLSLNGVTVWEGPQPNRLYVIGADPAEGNPQSDESAACVLDAVTGDQVAAWAGRFEPATFAAGLGTLAEWYGRQGSAVGVLVERNNHGHAVLLALREAGTGGVLRGLDGNPGWLTTAKGKALAVDAGADLLRDGWLSQAEHGAGRSPRVRDPETLRQLMAFSGSRLAAPPGDHDDRCMAWCLAAAAARYCSLGGAEAAVIPPAWQIDTRETGGW